MVFLRFHFIYDNREGLSAIGAAHLPAQCSLFKLAIGWVTFLTMVALDIFHHSPLCSPRNFDRYLATRKQPKFNPSRIFIYSMNMLCHGAHPPRKKQSKECLFLNQSSLTPLIILDIIGQNRAARHLLTRSGNQCLQPGQDQHDRQLRNRYRAHHKDECPGQPPA
jgi:hypothetical protein